MPAVGVLGLDAAGHPPERRLRRRVADPPAAVASRAGRVVAGRPRHHVDDGAAPPLQHVGDHLLDQQDLVHVVARSSAWHRLLGEVEDAVHRAQALVDRVVEQHVDATPLVEHLRRGSRRRRRRRAGPWPPAAPAARAARARRRWSPGCPGNAAWARRAPSWGRCGPGPPCTVRAVMATSKPASARASAEAFPMPRLAPVTSATGRSDMSPSSPGPSAQRLRCDPTGRRDGRRPRRSAAVDRPVPRLAGQVDEAVGAGVGPASRRRRRRRAEGCGRPP